MKKITTRFFVLSALSLGMAACQHIPKKEEIQTVVALPNVSIEESFDVLDQETVSVPQSPSMAAIRWQEFYADPKLKALIEIGLNHNKDLQRAMLAVQSVRAQYQIQDVADVPKVGISGGATRSTSGQDNNPRNQFNVNLAMSGYELDLWGKIASAKESALHEYLGTNAAKDAAQISLISSIAQGYVTLSYAIAQRHLAIGTLRTREHSLAIAKARFKAGVDAKSPSLQAEASLEGAKLAVYAAETEILQARNALQLLLGAPIPDELVPEMAVSNITTQTLFSAGLPSELLYYRPDIVQAEHALRSAGANIHVARAAYFPSISLSGNLGFSSSRLNDLLKSSAFGWSFGPSINLPIFDAGVRDANYELTQIAQKSALVAYEKAIQTAFKEVNDVLAVRATLGQRLNTQYRLQKNYQETYNIAHARFRSGLDNYLGVLDAERSLFDNQQNILALERQKVISQIQLYQVLGGGAVISAEQVAEFEKQRQAMQAATLATPEQVAALQVDGDTPAQVTEPNTETAKPPPDDSDVIVQ